MSYELEYCVFIGRCQPFHFGHKSLVDEALEIANNVIIVLGSCNQPFIRTRKNPWEARERMTMIDGSYKDPSILKRIKYILHPDFPGNDELWKNALKYRIDILTNYSKSIGLIGHEHDASSFYLKMFPEWKLLSKENIDKFPHATKIRELYFSGNKKYADYLPIPVWSYLETWKENELYKIL